MRLLGIPDLTDRTCVFAMVEGPGNKLKGEKMKSIVVGQVLSKVLSLQL